MTIMEGLDKQLKECQGRINLLQDFITRAEMLTDTAIKQELGLLIYLKKTELTVEQYTYKKIEECIYQQGMNE